MRYLLMFIVLVISRAAQAYDGYPGLPPDCWKESRVVAVDDSPLLRDNLAKRVTIDKVPVTTPEKFDFISPNKAYSFKATKDGRNESILIYAEKDHLVKINIYKIYFVDDLKWINEKLLFFRIWWGRMLATDIIFDVEKEIIAYSEAAMDGSNVFVEYDDKCRRLGGCRCIKKEEIK